MSFDEQIDALPPLPDYTDIQVERTESGVRLTLRPRRWICLCGRLYWACCVLMIAGLLPLIIATEKDDSLSWPIVGWIAVFVLGVGSGCVVMIAAIYVRTWQAAIDVDEHAMTVSETAFNKTVRHRWNRAQIPGLRTGATGKRIHVFGFTRDPSQRLRVLRRCRQVQLEVQTDELDAIGVALNWDEEDLDWIVQAVTQLWEIPRYARRQRHPVVQSQDVTDAHAWDVIVRFGHPVVITFLLVGSFALVVVGLPGLSGALWSQGWPSVTGEVLDAWQGTDTAGREPHFEVTMTYAYEVEQKRYENDLISFGYMDTSRTVRDFVKAHPRGATVRVFHHPQNPSRSVLIPGASWMAWIPLCVSAWLSIIAIWLLLTRGRYQRSATNMGWVQAKDSPGPQHSKRR